MHDGPRSIPLIGSLLLLLALASGAACGGGDDDGPSVDAAPEADADPDAPDAGVLPFMAECDPADDRCDAAAGDFCFNFNAKGPHCTRDCTGPEDCPEPSNDCNNMGVCKVPD